jgi:hypothetical protein
MLITLFKKIKNIYPNEVHALGYMNLKKKMPYLKP